MHLQSLSSHLAIIVLCVCSKPLECTSTPDKKSYTIGGWIPGFEETFLQQWRPLFEGYLTATAGTLYDPPINFTILAVDYEPQTSMEALLSQGSLDFVCKLRNEIKQDKAHTKAQLTFFARYHTVTTPGKLVCINEQFGFTPIATQRAITAGKQTSSLGSCILSASSNPLLTSISDIRDKEVGVGFSESATTYQLPTEVSANSSFADAALAEYERAQYLLLRGVNIFTDASKVSKKPHHPSLHRPFSLSEHPPVAH